VTWGCALHDLRHGFACALLKAGVNVKVVSEARPCPLELHVGHLRPRPPGDGRPGRDRDRDGTRDRILTTRWTRSRNGGPGPWLGDEPKGNTISAQVAELLAFRQIWDGFAYVYDNAPEAAREDAAFMQWFRYGYARSQALGVRRMADKRTDVVSLARLMDRVRQFPTVLSRERYVDIRSHDVGQPLVR
jgi:hypothetical protein